MAQSCPNRTRTKRPHPGGGTPGCRGKLKVVITTAIVLPLKSLGRGLRPSFDEALSAYVRQYGVRIDAAKLAHSYAGKATADIACDCGWSLNRLTTAITKASFRRSKR